MIPTKKTGLSGLELIFFVPNLLKNILDSSFKVFGVKKKTEGTRLQKEEVSKGLRT